MIKLWIEVFALLIIVTSLLISTYKGWWYYADLKVIESALQEAFLKKGLAVEASPNVTVREWKGELSPEHCVVMTFHDMHDAALNGGSVMVCTHSASSPYCLPAATIHPVPDRFLPRQCRVDQKKTLPELVFRG